MFKYQILSSLTRKQIKMLKLINKYLKTLF